jgi:hypothetical protein
MKSQELPKPFWEYPIINSTSTDLQKYSVWTKDTARFFSMTITSSTNSHREQSTKDKYNPVLQGTSSTAL